MFYRISRRVKDLDIRLKKICKHPSVEHPACLKFVCDLEQLFVVKQQVQTTPSLDSGKHKKSDLTLDSVHG